MKIDTKPLGIGKNSIDVQGSWAQVDQADELMISLYTIDADGDDMVKGLKAERQMMKQAMDFFKSIFGLTAKETDKIFNHVNSQVLNLYVTYACGMVKGAPYQSFADFQKSVEGGQTDPKDESAKAEK
jgi:hypothetical protein